jgi:hypothetical protein
MIGEIINMSDELTIDCTNWTAACVAVVLLGRGAYGLEADDRRMPVFLLGGFEEWWSENNRVSFDDYIESNPEDIAKALDSVTYGSAQDRRLFLLAYNAIPESERAEYKAKYDDEKRTSLNNIGARAASIAKNLREKAVTA